MPSTGDLRTRRGPTVASKTATTNQRPAWTLIQARPDSTSKYTVFRLPVWQHEVRPSLSFSRSFLHSQTPRASLLRHDGDPWLESDPPRYGVCGPPFHTVRYSHQITGHPGSQPTVPAARGVTRDGLFCIYFTGLLSAPNLLSYSTDSRSSTHTVMRRMMHEFHAFMILIIIPRRPSPGRRVSGTV